MIPKQYATLPEIVLKISRTQCDKLGIELSCQLRWIETALLDHETDQRDRAVHFLKRRYGGGITGYEQEGLLYVKYTCADLQEKTTCIGAVPKTYLGRQAKVTPFSIEI